MKKLLITLALTFVSACTVFPTQTQQVQAACASITASVNTLTIYADRLTPDQSAGIAKSLDAIYPVCGTGVAPSYDAVQFAALTALQAELTKLLAEVK